MKLKKWLFFLFKMVHYYNYYKSFIAVLSIAVLTGCTAISVRSDHDSQVNFSNYKTFSLCVADLMVENENQPLYDNSLNRSRIKNAIQEEMLKKGYVLNDSSPQLLAGFHIVIKDRTVMTSNCRDFAEYQYWPECRVNTYYYTEGTLIIYVTDIAKNQIIWQGSSEGVLDIKTEKMEVAITKTVSDIFKKFPLKKPNGMDKEISEQQLSRIKNLKFLTSLRISS